MIAAVASRELNDLGVRLPATVVAPIDMETGALEMGTDNGPQKLDQGISKLWDEEALN